MNNWVSDLSKILKESGVQVTFSRWCISGLVPDCKCRRCLTKRGKSVTDETERDAEERSKIETKAFYRRARAAIRKGETR